MIDLKEGYKDTEIGVIPIEWEVVKIVEVLNLMTDYVANGSFASLRENTTVYDSKAYAYYVRLFDLRRGLGHNAQRYVDEATYNFLDKSFLEGNEMLIANIGANVGESFLMPTTNIPATLAPNMIELKLNYEKMTPLFCFNYLKSGIGLSELDKVIEGSGQPKINKTKLKTIKIPLPPLKEQEKIANILSTADNKIETIAKQIEKAKTLKKGLLQKLLSEGLGHSEFKETGLSIVYPMRQIPKAWSLQTLSSITTKITDGAHFTPTYVESGIPFLRVTDLKSKDLLASKIKYIPEDEHLELLKRCKPEYGDILYSKNGTIGLTRIITWDWEFSIFVSLCLIKPNRDLIIPEYLKYYLTSSIVDTQIKIRAKQGTVTNLHLEEIRDFFITIPPIKEQKQIAQILSTADEKLEILRSKKEKYETLKKGLLQKLLSGEVRV